MVEILIGNRVNSLGAAIIAAAVMLISQPFSISAVAAGGECALDFLNIPVGAHSASMGQGSYAGITGAEALFLNPALSGSQTSGFASHQELLLDSRSDAASVSFQFGGKYAISAGMHLLDVGGITGYSSNNTRTGTIAAGDQLARIVVTSNGDLSYGLSFSYYHQRLDNISANGIGFGAGVALETSFGRLGMFADNFGPKFKAGNASSPLPAKYILSGWVPVSSGRLNISADFGFSRASGLMASGGLEYDPLAAFGLRAGSSTNDPLSLGLRLHAKMLSLDYCYIPAGEFGERHFFSFSITR